MRKKTVIVSGLHSGPNPSPGLGVARSLRAAVDVRIVGVDYSPSSSGMHSDLIDEKVVMPNWSEIEIPVWRTQITDLIRDFDGVYVSNLDAEARLIAQEFDDQTRFLSPGRLGMQWAVKPPTVAAEELGLSSPKYMVHSEEYGSLTPFIKDSPGGVWVKGQHYEAYRASTLSDVLAFGKYIDELWGPPWHVERHIEGQEESVAFVAHLGTLVDAVYMEKNVLTASGKTWAGSVYDVSPKLYASIEHWVAKSHWHGGGELELIRTWSGDRHLLEINPRLPAWIHGATIAGCNLPAALLSGRPHRSVHVRSGFTRIVVEIPLDTAIGMPSYPWSADASTAAATKHPSGMPIISQRRLLRGQAAPDASPKRTIVPEIGAPPTLDGKKPTPWVELSSEPMLAKLKDLRENIRLPRLQFAYSIKTNPNPLLLEAAAVAGMWFESISQAELDIARAYVPSVSKIIANGPAKWHPDLLGPSGTVLFIDRLEEFEHLREAVSRRADFRPDTLGLRLARDATTRFGVDITSTDFGPAIQELKIWCARLGIPWGVHFHRAQSVVGTDRWVEGAARVLEATEMLSEELGSLPDIVDLGGGWDPVQGSAGISSCIDRLRMNAPDLLEWNSTYVLEPGKALVQDCGRLHATIIGSRSARGDVVVDAGIPEAPEAPFWFHKVSMMSGSGLRSLPRGKGRILGRTCMENDILAEGIDTNWLRLGDRIVLEDVGAYDASMSYSFADGRR